MDDMREDMRLEKLEQRLDDLDRRESAMEKAMERSRAAVNTVIPSQTRHHMRMAWRENLLAVRSFIDYWAEKLDDQQGSSKSSGSGSSNNGGRENIPID